MRKPENRWKSSTTEIIFATDFNEEQYISIFSKNELIWSIPVEEMNRSIQECVTGLE